MVRTVCSTQWAVRSFETKMGKAILLANMKWELWAFVAVDESLKGSLTNVTFFTYCIWRFGGKRNQAGQKTAIYSQIFDIIFSYLPENCPRKASHYFPRISHTGAAGWPIVGLYPENRAAFRTGSQTLGQQGLISFLKPTQQMSR